jgi:thioredoxin reductase (NADPH)
MAITSERLIIIGSGPAALTAAVYAGRADLKPLVIEGENPGGQLMGTTFVENWPGYTRILGPELMHQMREHARTIGTRFVEGSLTKLIAAPTTFSIETNTTRSYAADCVILAMGALPKKLGCPGEEQYWGKSVTTCAVCDGALYRNKRVIVVGGGDSAMESASFLLKFATHITIVHILDKLTASYAMQKRVINNPAIKILYETTVTHIMGDSHGVTHVQITHQKTGDTVQIPADGVFIAIGLRPNTHMLQGTVSLDQWGYIVVTNNTHTSLKGVFAAGDIHDYRYRQAITAAGSGCMAALDAEQYLSSK